MSQNNLPSIRDNGYIFEVMEHDLDHCPIADKQIEVIRRKIGSVPCADVLRLMHAPELGVTTREGYWHQERKTLVLEIKPHLPNFR